MTINTWGELSLKKIIAITLALLLTITLVACGITDAEPTTPAEQPTAPTEQPDPEVTDTAPTPEFPEELVVQIDFATDELLANFDALHEVEYTTSPYGVRLAVWVNRPVADLSLIWLANDVIDEEIIFIPTDGLGSVEQLLPTQALVINNYMGLGTLPASGVRFVDEYGVRRYFAMIENMAYPQGDRWMIWEFENRANELSGS